MLLAADLSRAGGPEDESAILSNIRQLTFDGRRTGEGYFSADGAKMIFQSEREPGNPFYQIYVLDLTTGDTRRISPGTGKTTCGWIHPDGKRALFASTHLDPSAVDKQREELELRTSGRERRYAWDYDEHFDIFETNLDGGSPRNLTSTKGYDAEGSYSPDGRLIAFASNRHAYAADLSPADRQQLADDPKFFIDIYIMDSSGGEPKRLTDVPGYDGGPFFSHDGQRICWRRFSEAGDTAEVWTMNTDGSNARQVTRMGVMSWAPYFHPSGDYLIFTNNKHGFGNFELFIVDDKGAADPVRVTYTDGFDGLPAFSPDGKQLAWTSNRTADGSSQIFVADWNDAAARDLLRVTRSKTGPEPLSENITETDIRAHLQAWKDNVRILRSDAQPQAQVADLFQKFLGDLGEEAIPFDSGIEKDHVVVGSYAEIGLETSPGPRIVIAARIAWADLLNPDSRPLAVLMEIAQFLQGQMKRDQLNCKKGIQVALLVGPQDHNPHLKGVAFSEGPVAGLGGPVAAYIEITGWSHDNTQTVVRGVGTSQSWPAEIERRNVPVGLRLVSQNAPAAHPSIMALYERRIPVLSFHLPDGGDESSRVAEAAKLAKLIALIVRSVAASDQAIEFTPIVEREGAAAGRPYLGTEPDYAAHVETGVKLKGVVDNGPAAVAGVRAGDVIVQIGDRKIDDLNAYAAILDELKVGEEIKVGILRDGQRMTLTVRIGSRK